MLKAMTLTRRAWFASLAGLVAAPQRVESLEYALGSKVSPSSLEGLSRGKAFGWRAVYSATDDLTLEKLRALHSYNAAP